MSLPDRAGQVLDLMDQKHLGERPLLFICHSLGGLLVKQILRKADDAVDSRKKKVAQQTRAVLFLATPHAGAELASLVNAFRTVFGATVSIEDLRLHDTHLRDLFGWYRNQSPVLGIQTETYYEMRGIKGVLPIVNPTSAHPAVGPDPVPLDEDHLSIAKPRDRDDQVCDAAREILRNYVLSARSAAQTPPQSVPIAIASEPPTVIVQVQASGASSVTIRITYDLPPAAEKHFGRQTELKRLTDRLLAGKNSAVVGPAGIGKTALAAEAVRASVGESLATSPFPDGVVFLDLYTYRGQAEPAWNNLANALGGPGFMETSPARERATEACRARRALIIIEGGEEADGEDGRTSVHELCSVFSSQNRCLLLTRLSTQTVPAESVELKEALHPSDAADLLDSLTQGRVTGSVPEQVLELVEGHPLALTWAGGLLARDDDDPERLVSEWKSDELPNLSDPKQAEHTLEWLFNRSVRGLDKTGKQLLATAGLLARAPLPFAAMVAVLDDLPEDAATARAALKSLVQRGLLRRSEEPEHWQFTHVLGYRFARKETGSDHRLRDGLGRWLIDHLDAVIADSVSHEVSASLTRGLEHAAALLRADHDQRLWIPLAHGLLYDIRDSLWVLGRLDLVGLALGAVEDWLTRFPTDEANKTLWLRERSVLLNRQCEVFFSQGDLTNALVASRESLGVMLLLTKTDPSNEGWQRDVGVSYNKVGRVLEKQGDLPEALRVYTESVTIWLRLVDADPSDPDRQRDLCMGHEYIGGVLRAQGNLESALSAFRKSLQVIQLLAQTDPSNADWQLDLSITQEGIGDVLRDQGDNEGAIKAYQESLAVRRRFAAADSSNANWQRGLAVILSRMANLYVKQGNRAEALALAKECLEVDERLAALDRTNVAWQKDVVVSRALVARMHGE